MTVAVAATARAPARVTPKPAAIAPQLDRGRVGATADCEECDRTRVQRSRDGTVADPSRRARTGAIVHSGSTPLDPATRAFMEPRFGHDFSHVRVHADAAAASAAQAWRAAAYTVGSHIVFGSGRYAPGTAAGRLLLAHELAHVVQQAGACHDDSLRRAPTSSDRDHEDDALEHEAEHAAARVASGATTRVGSACSQCVQRQPLEHDDCQVGVERAVDLALGWLDRSVELLQRWAATPAGRPPTEAAAPDTASVPTADARVGRLVEQILHTSDRGYTQVVAMRLGEIARQMRAGLITVQCTSLAASAIGRPTGSSVGGTPAPPTPRRPSLADGVITAGTTSERTAVGVAGLGLSGSDPSGVVETLIHEYAHAVLPAVGIRHRERTGPVEVHDWAYHHERAFATLTPEQALNNAETYGQLAMALGTGRELAVSDRDSYTGFGTLNVDPLRRAFALAEQRLELTRKFLAELTEPGAGPNLAFAQRHLGSGDAARWLALRGAIATVGEAIHSHTTLHFSRGGGRTALAWSSRATITAAGLAAGTSATAGINVGPAFFELDAENQTRVIQRLLLANHPTLRAQTSELAALGAELASEVLREPASHAAADHLQTETTRVAEEQRRVAARDRLLTPLRRGDGTGLWTALNGLDAAERAAVSSDRELLDALRGLSPMARLVITMRLQYGPSLPEPARRLNLALHDRDAAGVRSALQTDRTLSDLRGLRDAVQAQLPDSAIRRVILSWLPAPAAVEATASAPAAVPGGH